MTLSDNDINDFHINQQMDVTLTVLALSGNGACFPIHVDSDDSLDGRRLTGACALSFPQAVFVYLHARSSRFH